MLDQLEYEAKEEVIESDNMRELATSKAGLLVIQKIKLELDRVKQVTLQKHQEKEQMEHDT